MTERYTSMQSYQDCGAVRVYSRLLPLTIDLTFQTYFVRPDLFRFEWHSQSRLLRWSDGFRHYAAIWSNGDSVYTYWNTRGLREERSLKSAVAGATGISHGSAHTVYRLLNNKVGGFTFTELQQLSKLHGQKFEGTPCHTIRGRHPRGGTYKLWIGKEDLLIRKVRSTSGIFIQEETRQEIRVNSLIPGTTFYEFAPDQQED